MAIDIFDIWDFIPYVTKLSRVLGFGCMKLQEFFLLKYKKYKILHKISVFYIKIGTVRGKKKKKKS